ncbi:MAG: amino acid ABC transporter substrate-binding protein [Alphaproteobacteria bacterium]
MKKLLIATAFAAASFVSANAGTLEDVKKRGYLKCAVSTGAFGLSYTDDSGRWQGLDVEYCRGVAAAIFGSGEKVKFTGTTTKNRFTILQSGEVDILARNTTWTLSRDTDLGLDFVGINWYDGAGFMANNKLGVKSAKELDGATVCIQPGTTTELALADYFKVNGMKFEPVTVETQDDALKALKAGRCDVYTTDTTGLAGVRASMPNPDNWSILPELISKEPLGPVVRHGDSKWADIARWVLNVNIAAEELGVTSKNVGSFKNSKNQEILRMLGHEGDLGKFLGLRKDFGYQVIKTIGNYGEVYNRTMKLTGLPRGVNQPWTKGGLLYVPPLR